MYIFIQLNDVQKGIGEYYCLLSNYENEYRSKDFEYTKIHEIEKNIKFDFFHFFFNTLFGIQSIKTKIIKCYFEIKSGYIKLALNLEALKVIEGVYEKYPDDILVLSEVFKLNVYVLFLFSVEIILEQKK